MERRFGGILLIPILLTKVMPLPFRVSEYGAALFPTREEYGTRRRSWKVYSSTLFVKLQELLEKTAFIVPLSRRLEVSVDGSLPGNFYKQACRSVVFWGICPKLTGEGSHRLACAEPAVLGQS